MPPQQGTGTIDSRQGQWRRWYLQLHEDWISMHLTDEQRSEAAAALRDAEEQRTPIGPLSASYPGIDLDDAYRIQSDNIERRLADGARLVGRKVGLTSASMQEMMGIDDHDYGVILDTMVGSDGGTLEAGRFCAPRVEVEIAFLLARPLVGPGVTVEDVLAATTAVAPSIEIIDSRIADWRITFEDTVADNASSGAMVVGAWLPVGDLDLAAVGVELVLDGDVVGVGIGASVLGHPAKSVAWLANTLAPLGSSLEAGQVVLPGSCTRAFDVLPGSHVEGRFAGLGSVSVSFT